MKGSTEIEMHPSRSTRYAWILAIAWTVTIALFLAWSVAELGKEELDMARIRAQASFEQELLYRGWIASRGEVYAAVNEDTQPDPYLADLPERDITTPSGKQLTLITPAYMARQVHALQAKGGGDLGHITSLNPLRPENAPDPWEVQALRAFAQGKTEVSSVEKINGQDYMRLMRPLITEQSCLQCHAQQGYKEGDIRGGISVSIPLAPERVVAHTRHISGILAEVSVWLLGLGGIAVATRRLRRDELAWNRLQGTLQDAEIRYRTIFEQSPDGVLIIDPETTLPIEFNSSAHGQLGYSREEFSRLRVSDYETLEMPEATKAHIEKISREGRADFETRHRTKQGEIRNVQVTVKKIELSGRVLFHCILRDISERKRAEEALQIALTESVTRERQMSALLGASRAVFATSTFEEAARQIFDICRQVTGATSGYVALLSKDGQENEVLFLEAGGLPCNVNPSLPMPIRGLRAEAFKSDKVVYDNAYANSEWRRFIPEGHVALHNVMFAPMNFKGKTVGLLGLANKPRDFTEEDAALAGALADTVSIAFRRARDEEALRKSESRYRTLFDSASDAIFIMDLDGRILEANQMACERLGYSREELLQMRIADIDSPEYKALVLERTEALLQSGNITFETANVRRDGTVIPVEASVRLIEYAGSPAALSIARDITERKCAEDERRRFTQELERRVQERTVELAQANVLLEREVTERKQAEQNAWREYETQSTINTLLRLSSGHIALEEILQCALDTVLSISWLSFESKGSAFLSQDDQVLVMAAQRGLDERIQEACARVPFGRCLCGRAALAQEIQFAACLDERHEIGYEGMPPHGHYCVPILSAGRILGVINIYTREGHRREQREEEFLTAIANALAGIIERRKTVEALRVSEQRYRTIFESAREGIIISGPDGKISSANRAVAVMLGYNSQEELVGMPAIALYVDPKHRERMFKELIKKGYIEDYELIFRRKDSTLLYVLGSATAQKDGEGNLLRVEDIFTNITERKQMEIALTEERAFLTQRVADRTAELSAANAELARTAHLKDEFLASTSHELRTPLNAVLGLAEALQEEVYGPLNEKQSKSLRTIEESGHHLLALINDILDVSKVEAGKLELEIGPVSVESVCQASLGLIKQSAHKKRLKVSSSLDSAVTMLQADERRLKQILVNLLSNAVKFTPDEGEIGLEVVGDAQGEVVRFTVWDTGIGISAEDTQRLFRPFVQLDSSLSRQYAGTGLGLALVRRLVEMHGGSVTVQSQVGRGSRFTVALPWHMADGTGWLDGAGESAKLAVAAKRPASQEADRPLILLAEDNEDNINTISDYLLAKGYRVTVARNGSEAIEQANEQRPDLILMDIQMPGMDGLEATRRLRAITDLARVPIIALTALAMPGDRERCLATGANEYLSKPVSLRRLLQVIEEQRQHRLDDGKHL